MYSNVQIQLSMNHQKSVKVSPGVYPAVELVHHNSTCVFDQLVFAKACKGHKVSFNREPIEQASSQTNGIGKCHITRILQALDRPCGVILSL